MPALWYIGSLSHSTLCSIFSCIGSLIYEKGIDKVYAIIYSCRLDDSLAFLFTISFPGIPGRPGIQQSSTVFPDFCRLAMICFSFRTFEMVGICLWNACRQLLEFVNIEKFFPFDADIVFRAKCITGVSAVNIELNSGCDAYSVRFPVKAAAHTPISFLEPSVYMCFHPVNSFSMLLWVVGSPQVGSSISSRKYEKSGRTCLVSKFSFVCFFFILIANGGRNF